MLGLHIEPTCMTALGVLAALALTGAMTPASAVEPQQIGSRLQLFTAGGLIASFTGDARLRMHRPVPRDVALVADDPWGGNVSGYFTVFQDGSLYRMYYRGAHVDYTGGETTKPHRQVTCYAQSVDGIHWVKPELGLHEFEGSTANNIILDGTGTHNFTPFLDPNPDAAPDARYKAVARAEGGLVAFTSADGIHWELLREEPVITQGAFDSQNVVFRDTVRGEYRAYWRAYRGEDVEGTPPGRDIMTATSEDFVTWSEPRWVRYAPGRRGTEDTSEPYHQLYTNGVLPYYRAPQIFLGFPTRYIDHGWRPSTRLLPNQEYREQRAECNTREGTAFNDGLFMSSRNGRDFFVWPEAFIPPGIQRQGSWSYGDNYQAWGVVETPSDLPGAPNELSIYATENQKETGPTRLRRFTLRIDGFVSAHASLHGGTIITHPVIFAGDRLQINFASSAGGHVKVELQEPDGTPIEGFTLDDCVEIFGDELERVVQWGETTNVSAPAGTPVRLRVELLDADLYSFQFVDR